MKLRELFYSNYYNIAFRRKNDDDICSDREWIIVKSSNLEWFADPFLFKWDGRHYIFAERMNRLHPRGTVAFCEIFDDGTVSDFKEVLIESFHLSYPNVFAYSGTVYMIPETGHRNDLRLYKSVQFPHKWKLEKVLFSGANFVDTSFVGDIKDGHTVLYSFDWDTRNSHFFNFDLERFLLLEYPENPKMMNERSGGNYFKLNGEKYRVLQDCSRTYGEKLIINRIDCDDFEGGNASDSLTFELLPQSLKFDKKSIKASCCHTYNQTEDYEVVDFLSERFVWFQPFLIFRRKALSAFHKLRRIMTGNR